MSDKQKSPERRHLHAVPDLPPEQLELGVEPAQPPLEFGKPPEVDTSVLGPDLARPRAIGRPALRAVGTEPDPWAQSNSPESLGMNAESSRHNMRITSHKNMTTNVGIFGIIVDPRKDGKGGLIRDGSGYRRLEKAFVALRDLYPDPNVPPNPTDIHDFGETERLKVNSTRGMTSEKANVILMCDGLGIIQNAMQVMGSKSPLEIAYDQIGAIDQSLRHGQGENPTRAEEILARIFSEAAIFLSTYDGRGRPRKAVEDLRIALAKAAGYESPYPHAKYVRGMKRKKGAGADSVIESAKNVLYGIQQPGNVPPPVGA